MSTNISQPQFALSCNISSAGPPLSDGTYSNGHAFLMEMSDVGFFQYYINFDKSINFANPSTYGAGDVKVGDWVGTSAGKGACYQILSIVDPPTTGSAASYIVADIDGYCAATFGSSSVTAGAGCIFRLNEDGIPGLSTSSTVDFFNGLSNPLLWISEMVARFALRNNKTQYVSIYQSVAKTITGASITGARTLYDVADTSGLSVGNTVIIEGIELGSATGYNGTGSIHAIDPNVSVTVNITSSGTPDQFAIATLRIGSVPRGRDFVVGESLYIDSSGIFRKSAGSLQISDTVGIVTSKGIPSDDWFSFRPSGKYFDTTVFPNDFFPTPAIIQQVGGNNVTLTEGMKLYINPNSGRQYTTVAPTSNPYATWIMISATRAIYIAGSGGGGGGSTTTVVTGTVQVFDGGDPTWASAPPEVIYPVLDCGGI